MKQFMKYIALIVCACSCWACMDDEVGQEIDYSKPATVKLSIDFSDMQVVTPGTRSAGDAIGKMTDVCVLFYKEDGTLAMDGTNPIYHYATVSSAEPANFTKTVPAGKYKVVAVANMGNLTENEYKDNIKTLEDLKSISLTWNNDTIAANNQMFGFFNTSSTNSIDDAISKVGMSNVAPTSYDAQDLTLSGVQTLYAKLYRTVAKVTVAFDGSGLNSNVFVTIKSIRLGNLPGTCFLWKENKDVTNTLYLKEATGTTGENSEKLTEENFGLLKVRNRGTNENESLFPEDAHSQTGPSLFMFENRQGTITTSGDKDKTIAKTPYGAFIEIEAQYANESTGSNGKIIYRYMLGEDTPNKYDNYNLTRNRHYKVTLMLQKSGKEKPYWRVEYTENPSINLPTEVNISYRNSAKLDIPFTVADAKNIKTVEVQITDNPWYDDLIDGHRDATVGSGTLVGNIYGFLAWAGFPSNDDNYGTKKEKALEISTTGENGTYKLSIQTEALAFKTDQGPTNERAASFSGYNNYSNPRTATIEVIVTYNSNEKKTAKVKVVQVPRVVNPIAIYRNYNNDDPFNIRLLNASGIEIESHGPWKAEVESGKDWIRIKREGEDPANYSSEEITSGESGGAIRFDYKPLTKLDNEEQTRCGVIVVRFSNYKVEHRIYVRQGYAPIAIGTSESLWTSFNYIGVDINNHPLFTTSPMEEGAWLRLGNSVGILADNTHNKGGFNVVPTYFNMSNESTVKWNQIGKTNDMNAPFIAPNYELPTQSDVSNIQDLKEYSGFGIGYDDEATKTVPFNEEEQYTNSAMGRRGFVICDIKGRNLFFPTGKRGYGRRRNIMNGALHYTNATSDPSGANRPALIGLPRAMGAIYWANGNQKLSFNYSLSNIEMANGNDNGVGNDACFARLVEVKIIKMKRGYNLKINNRPVLESDKASAIAWGGDVNDVSLVYRSADRVWELSLKYNKNIKKDENGVIFKVSAMGSEYTKTLSIKEIETLNEEIGSPDINLIENEKI